MKCKVLCVIGKSQYDSTAIFMEEISRRMSEAGWNVTLLDGRNEEEYAEKRNKILTDECCFNVVLTINGMMLEKDSLLGQMILGEKQPVYCTYLMDHPIIHWERLKNDYSKIVVLSPDRNHVDYIKNYMKNISMAGFLPHGGCMCRSDIPYTERKYEVVFMGSYVKPEKVWESFDHYPQQMALLMKDAAGRMISDTSLTLEKAVLQSFSDCDITSPTEQFRDVLCEFRDVDRYVRCYFRDKVLRALVKDQIAVDVFGDGWEAFSLENLEFLRIHDRVDYLESLEIIGDSKISLNVMPWFKDGAHDRVFSAMLCGAVCCTDNSGYLEEVLRQDENVIFYSLNGLRYLSKKIREVLNNTEKGALIAREGKKIALKDHTWKNRADEVMNILTETLVSEKNGQSGAEDLFYEQIIEPQSRLVCDINQTLYWMRRQEYLYAMRKYREIIYCFDKLLPFYQQWDMRIRDYNDAFDISHLLEILSNLMEVQEREDYILLADYLEFQLLPCLLQIQEGYGAAFEKELIYGNYKIELTSSGAFTVAAKNNEHWKYLHTNGDPYAEARNLAVSWFDGEHFDYIVYGMGLGYHVKALLDLDENITVTVFDTDQEIVFLANKYGILDIENNSRLEIVVDPDFRRLSMLANEEKRQVVIHYPSVQKIANESLRSQLEDYFIAYSSMKTQEICLKGNFIKNCSAIEHEVSELRECFQGKTVYIIAAGPSLDKNIHELRQVKQDSIVLATGTVLKKLLHANIIPDYVIITDGGAFTYHQTENLQDIYVPLLHLSTVYYQIPQTYPGDKYIIFQKDFRNSEEYAEKHGYPLYETGGSVTTTALDLCIRFQCSRVVFVGLDLAYTDHTNHASDTMDVNEHAVGNRIVKDIYGNDVTSAKNLCIYRQWIENRLQEKDACEITFIDATEGGALIKGTRIQTLQTTIQENV